VLADPGAETLGEFFQRGRGVFFRARQKVRRAACRNQPARSFLARIKNAAPESLASAWSGK
jgi:hypothetical protein